MQTDWVVRQISQFTHVLSIILGLKKRRRYEASLDAIGEALDTLLGLTPDALRTQSADELLRRITLTETAMVGREKCLFVAALLKESGDIYVAQEQFEDGAAFYLKALQLMLALRLNDDLVSQPSYAPEIEVLLAELDFTSLPLDTQSNLVLYYEQSGGYGKAEDVLFEMLDAVSDIPENVADIARMGIAFYERLQQKSDDALMAGNLSRDEVEASLEEVRGYLS
jgi:tetratricopeptide (TPR) repeat protein